MRLLTIIVSNVLGKGAEDHHALADELILRAARTGVITWVAASKFQPFSDATSVVENVF
jgi:uncharacterized protein (DUF2236 family)